MPRTVILAASLTLAGCASAPSGTAPYRDATLPVEARVDDLLQRMTLEEKVAQLGCIWPRGDSPEHLGQGLLDGHGDLDPAAAAAILQNGIGHLARPSEGKDIAGGIAFANAIQKHLLEHTRLGIPALFHEEGLHGHMAEGATSFPQALALACTFDPELIERVFTAVAAEMHARGAHQALTPVLDVARDPRWGRTEETYGEDPFLTSRLGVACIRGFQGAPTATGALAPGRVLATAKHFVAHGAPEAGTNCAPANWSPSVLRAVFLPPFEAAVRQAGVASVMAVYHEVDAVPMHANRALLVGTLREEWGFTGTVVSDYHGIEQLDKLHHVVADEAAAGRMALAVGVDVELPDANCYTTLVEQVRRGFVDEGQIDRSVRRVLHAKFQAGVFERPFADEATARAIIQRQDHRELALAAARKAVVLLQNRDDLLPLDARALRTIAVVGPNADRALLGGYTAKKGPGEVVTVLAGIRAFLQAQGSRVKVEHAEGCGLTVDSDWFTDEVKLADPAEDDAHIAAAVEAARGADVCVLVLGGNEATCREGWNAEHLGDRDDLALLGRQQELADRIHALGKPMVVLLISGRPLAVPKLTTQVQAILQGFYLGQAGGTAFAEILFGAVEPSGRLPITIPRSVGQIPAHYGQKPSGRRGYLFTDSTPLFPFGHGLGYTRILIGRPRLVAATIRAGDEPIVEVDVENAGQRPGTQVVQCYLRDRVSSITRPVLELCGFTRVELQPGERRTVRMTIPARSLAMPGGEVEPGEFEIHVGRSSAKLESTTLLVVTR